MEMCDEISAEAYKKLMNYLEELPSAQPEIIQCKDCKHSIDFYGDGECYCRRPNRELDWIGDWNFIADVRKGGKMTNKDIFDIFQKRYPEMKTIDYRPLSNLFRPTGYGITIWTDRGDVILYFPKEGEKREE
jgi:hypothetical protein